MSITKKFVFVYSLFIVFLILSTVLIHQFFIKNTILDIEKNYIIEDLKKLDNFFNTEKQNLLVLTQNWSARTDAWLFMQDKNPSFIENNLTIESFTNNKVNLIAYFDLKGKLKKGFEYYSETKKLSAVDEYFWGKYIEKILKMTERNSLKMQSLVGFTFKNDKPYLVAVCPVLKSDFAGPVAGYLIISRMITEEKQNSIKNLFGFSGFKIENLKDTGKELKSTQVIMENSVKYIVLYRTEDFFGSYSIGLNIEKEKKLWSLVKGSNLKLITFYASLFLIFGFVFYLWFKGKIINKIMNLATYIDEVKAGKADEVKIDSKDEIGNLAEEINIYISTVKKHMLEIEENCKIYQIIAEKSEEIILLFNKQGNIIFANPKAIEYLGGEKFDISPEDLKPFIQDILKLTDEEMSFWREIKLPDGTFLSAWIVPIEEKTGTMLLIAHDITFFQKEKNKLIETATKDALTFLYNRNFFEESLKKSIESTKRGDFFSLIFIDMDDLKKINDQFGHIAGDAMIRAVAKAIIKSVRGSDLAARWGGDEFVILIKGGIEQAKTVAERIQTNLKKITITFKDETIIPSVSMGITNIDASKDRETLLREADKAVYDAKKEGKNKIKVFE